MVKLRRWRAQDKKGEIDNLTLVDTIIERERLGRKHLLAS